MPSTGYVHSAVALWWYYMRQISRVSWLPLQTMERNEVFCDHPSSKIITLHLAMTQGLPDAALNLTFKAFAALFLMSLEATSNLRISWQQLLACCALPGRMILLELLPIASVMMAAGQIISTSRHSMTGITDLHIKSNLRLHPISLYYNTVTSIGTTFSKPQITSNKIFYMLMSI